jgi:hypothetical protein
VVELHYWCKSCSNNMKSILILLNVFFIGSVCFYVYTRCTSSIRSWYWPTLLFHLASGMCIGLLYFYYYSQGDTLSYFSEGAKLAEFAKQNPASYLSFLFNSQAPDALIKSFLYQDTRALFMVKLTSLTNLLTYDNYWIASMYFSSISFFSAWKLTDTLLKFYPSKKVSIIFSFLLLPSVVFWSSGIVKESIALATLFYLVHLFIHVYKKKSLAGYQLVFFIGAVWVLYSLKYYYVAVLIPVFITALLHQKLLKTLANKSIWFSSTSWLLLFLIISIGVTQLHPNFHPNRFLSVLFNNYVEFQSYSQLGDAMIFTSFRESWLSVILHAPWAFISGLFRPFIWESMNVLQVFASLENLVLLILTLTALPSLRKFAGNQDDFLVFATLVYCFVLGAFLTLSTPNFGTLIRYRVALLPFFVFLITCSNPLFFHLTKFVSIRIEQLATRN